MPEIPFAALSNFLIYLSIPFIFAAAAKYIKFPPVIGYMIGGIALGNLFGNLISKDIINQFAFFGIALLLFTVGLEVNFSRILSFKRFIVLGGALQLATSILLISIISMLFGLNLLQSLLVGIALASSSTALVAKTIQDRGEEGSFLGEIILGLLMFQDLAFIPFIIIFNSITLNTISPLAIVKNIFIDVSLAAIILYGMFFLGQKIIPIVFDRIARLSRELLNFFIIIFIFAVALLSIIFKIPILVGVFVAGVLVSQTSEHYHIFTRIRPIRDMLAIVFFIFIGSNVNLSLVLPIMPKILLFSLIILLLKITIIIVVFLSLRFSSRLAFYTGLSLFQIDEDAFILMSLAYANKIFSHEQYLFVISVTLIGLIITPLLMSNKERIFLALRAWLIRYIPNLDKFIKTHIDFTISPIDVLNIHDHVVICGYGRVGSMVGRALTLANIPFIAVDYNFHTVEAAKREDVNIIYGDPSDIDILDFLETEEAIAVVAAVPSRHDQEAIIINAKKLNPNVFIISRAQNQKDNQRMRDLGANTVIQPELEASVSIIKRIFILKDMPKDDIVKSIRHLKLIHGGI